MRRGELANRGSRVLWVLSEVLYEKKIGVYVYKKRAQDWLWEMASLFRIKVVWIPKRPHKPNLPDDAPSDEVEFNVFRDALNAAWADNQFIEFIVDDARYLNQGVSVWEPTERIRRKPSRRRSKSWT